MLSRLPPGVKRTFQISEGLYCTVQIVGGVATFATKETATNSIRHLASFFVVGFVACVLIVSSYRLRIEINKMFPALTNLTAMEREMNSPLGSKPSLQQIQLGQSSSLDVNVKSSHILAGSEMESIRPSPRSPRSNKPKQQDVANVLRPQKAEEQKTRRPMATTKSMLKRQSSGRVAKFKALRTAKGVRRKLDLLLVLCPCIFILGCGVLMYLFAIQVSSRSSYADGYRDEKSNYTSSSDLAHYLAIVVICFFEWYSSVPLGKWVFAPFEKCCIQFK
mmetsp:Transcript_11424/g.28130  ORF Transcript_11424/g.28130 Transcript_11424/m.28130 type:complete len:277 (+) Transcript_11424:417-1247(+)